MRIYAPVKDFNGLRNNVRFVNGVGETENSHLIEWFRSHGYCIEKYEKCAEKPVEKCEKCADTGKIIDESEFVEINKLADEPNEPNFDAMTSEELRDWAKANGLGGVIKNTRNKEKLLELIRG